MEVQTGSQTKRLEDACSATHFNMSGELYITLISSTLDTRACPHIGKFQVNNIMRIERSVHHKKLYSQPDSRIFEKYILHTFMKNDIHQHRRSKRTNENVDCDTSGYASLIIGCNSVDTMEFKTGCDSSGLTKCK
ncbi:hypothetical protein WA026_008475 [Henosepilachna vigintioctopunctata]|uniref:Uncharacterized protein n=1 Tax=Henosepilachna vigintioctopunctata TaxID=420089 RepID=A0AAW1UIQ9_9CUCU